MRTTLRRGAPLAPATTFAPAALAAALAATMAMACTRTPSLRIETVGFDGMEVDVPTVALSDDGGTGWVAWVGTRDGGSDVYVARADADGPGEPVRVNDIDGDAAPHRQAPPQVAVGPGGTLYVVWQNNTHVPGRRFPASDLRLARSTDGGRTWDPAVYVNDDAGGPPSSHTFHDIAVAPDGTVFVSWIDGRERSRAELAHAAAMAGGDVAHGAQPGHDDAHVMHGDDMPGSQVRVARSTDGGRSFGPGVVVADDVCPCCRTSIVAGAGGRVHIAFRTAVDNLRDIVVATSTDGGASFGEPARVHRDGWNIDGCPHAGAALALDDAGRLHVAWYTGAEERQGLWYATSRDGTAFDEPVPVLTGGWVPVSQVGLAAAGGDVWLAWEDRRGETPEVRMAPVRAGSPAGGRVVGTGISPALAAAHGPVMAWLAGDAIRLGLPGR